MNLRTRRTVLVLFVAYDFVSSAAVVDPRRIVSLIDWRIKFQERALAQYKGGLHEEDDEILAGVCARLRQVMGCLEYSHMPPILRRREQHVAVEFRAAVVNHAPDTELISILRKSVSGDFRICAILSGYLHERYLAQVHMSEMRDIVKMLESERWHVESGGSSLDPYYDNKSIQSLFLSSLTEVKHFWDRIVFLQKGIKMPPDSRVPGLSILDRAELESHLKHAMMGFLVSGDRDSLIGRVEYLWARRPEELDFSAGIFSQLIMQIYLQYGQPLQEELHALEMGLLGV